MNCNDITGVPAIKHKTMLVTGAAGFIGSHLVDRLISDGHRVTGIDDLSSGNLGNLPACFDLRTMDIREPDVRDVVADIRPDVIFHLAAQISVSISVREPLRDADINVGGSLNLFEGIRAAGGKSTKVVYVTSGGTVYGEPETLPVDEFNPIRPLSPYGASKLAVETYLPVYERLCGLQYTIIRLANIYGPRQDPHGEAGVVAIFCRAMLDGRSLTVFGDGNNERDYVYVGDAADGIVKAAESTRPGPFNIGTGVGTTTNRIFEVIAQQCKHTAAPVYGPARAGDVCRISLDATRAQKQLGWAPQVSIKAGLKRTVDWFREQTDEKLLSTFVIL